AGHQIRRCGQPGRGDDQFGDRSLGESGGSAESRQRDGGGEGGSHGTSIGPANAAGRDQTATSGRRRAALQVAATEGLEPLPRRGSDPGPRTSDGAAGLLARGSSRAPALAFPVSQWRRPLGDGRAGSWPLTVAGTAGELAFASPRSLLAP